METSFNSLRQINVMSAESIAAIEKCYALAVILRDVSLTEDEKDNILKTLCDGLSLIVSSTKNWN